MSKNPALFAQYRKSPETCVKKLVVTSTKAAESKGAGDEPQGASQLEGNLGVSRLKSLKSIGFPPNLFLHKYLPDNKQGNLMLFQANYDILKSCCVDYVGNEKGLLIYCIFDEH